MYRTKVKGLFQKPTVDANTEPHFHKMPYLKRPSKMPQQAQISSCDRLVKDSDMHVRNLPELREKCRVTTHQAVTERSDLRLSQFHPVDPTVKNSQRMGFSKEKSLYDIDADTIEPLQLMHSFTNKGSYFPMNEMVSSINGDFREFLSALSIFNQFVLEDD
eukprot:10142290-Ditylum_brightwellii.AAC.1